MDNKIFDPARYDYRNKFESPLNIRGLTFGTVSRVRNDKNDFVQIDVNIANGGVIENIPFWGGQVTKSKEGTFILHGIFIPPVIGQVVALGFINDLAVNPVVVSTLFTPSSDNPEEIKAYSNEITEFDAETIYLAHYTGTLVKMNPDGSLDIRAKDKINVYTEKEINVTGKTINLNVPEGSAPKGVARKGDTVIATKGRIGKTFFEWLANFVKLFETIVPQPVAPGSPDPTLVTFVTQLSAFLAINPVPTTILSEIAAASTVVNAGD